MICPQSPKQQAVLKDKPSVPNLTKVGLASRDG